VPPSKENNARTERIIGNWMKARGNRSQVRNNYLHLTAALD
jgi:hypothetical protein